MRKRLAIFLGEFGREFQKNFSNYVKTMANSKGYDVFIFNNFGSYASTFLFDVGEKCVIKIPVLSTFDGIIMIPDTFDIAGMEDMLMEKVREEAKCPVVSIRNGSTETYKIVIDDYNTSYKMTEHFIKQHGFKNICYMSGPLDTEDSANRYKGFLDAMKDNGIETSDAAFFEGDFWTFKSKEATEKFLKAYNGKTEAIIFGNDYMAIGVCEELKARGISIPEEIAVAGYDEIIEGKTYNPVLTTVRMPVEEMAIKALSIIEDVNNGIDVPKICPIQGAILYKASCGCHTDIPKSDVSSQSPKLSDEYVNIRNASFITADIQNHITEDEKLEFISGFREIFNFEKIYLCLCTEDVTEPDNPFTNEMLLRAVLPLNCEYNKKPAVGKTFDRKLIIPEEVYDSSTPSTFVVFPIHHKNTTFGYIVTEWNDNDFTLFIAPFTGALALAYDDLRMQQQFSELIEIKKLNFRDSLTGLYNRRGFEQSLSNLISSKTHNTKLISFLSADIDNLKEINDTYGHYEGDTAIILFAEVLKTVTDGNDICSRVGGDEFSIVLTSPDREIHENFIRSVYEELDRRNEEDNNVFDVHASIGICTVGIEEIGNAFELLKIADKKMYESKTAYKEKIK